MTVKSLLAEYQGLDFSPYPTTAEQAGLFQCCGVKSLRQRLKQYAHCWLILTLCIELVFSSLLILETQPWCCRAEKNSQKVKTAIWNLARDSMFARNDLQTRSQGTISISMHTINLTSLHMSHDMISVGVDTNPMLGMTDPDF